MSGPLLRREFVHLFAAGAGGGLLLAPSALEDLTAHVARRLADRLEQAAPPRFAVLTPDEARAVEAITARIIPNDDGTPGAREAGVVYFVDRYFEKWAAHDLPDFRTDLATFDAAARDRVPEVRGVADLSDRDLDAVLATLDKTPARQHLTEVTLYALFASPSHGGNKDQIGWRLIGHDSAMQFASPYGYYDRPENLRRLKAEAAAKRAGGDA